MARSKQTRRKSYVPKLIAHVGDVFDRSDGLAFRVVSVDEKKVTVASTDPVISVTITKRKGGEWMEYRKSKGLTFQRAQQ